MKVSFSLLASCALTLMVLESPWERLIVRTLLTVSTTELSLRVTVADAKMMFGESSRKISVISRVEMLRASVKVRSSWSMLRLSENSTREGRVVSGSKRLALVGDVALIGLLFESISAPKLIVR